MPSLPQAVFFDMDGTILDWQTGMEERWLAACEAHCDGSFVPATMHAAIRTRREWYWDDPERARSGRLDLDAASRAIVRHAFADAQLEDVDLADRIAHDYRADRLALTKPYAGAIETLQTLRARGVPMALLTNGGAAGQRESIEHHDIGRYFECVIIEGEFGIGKPDERVFRHAFGALSGEPATTWMVGDSLEADIAPALALGMHAVWVAADGQELPNGGSVQPDRIVRAIRELV